jgi:DNA-binding winged helix-turn-helix (wHTH) protein/Tol biopolymer transport system component
MPEPTQNAKVIRFGAFEVDLQAGELRKSGLKIKLQDQPFHILALLLERPGQVVTREELQQKLWPADTFVEFDHSLNSAVKKLRKALGDDSDNPRFVETLPRRGYRLIVPVNSAGPAPEKVTAEAPPAKPGIGERSPNLKLAIPAAALVALAAVFVWRFFLRAPTPPRVLRFVQLSNDGQAKTGPLVTDGSRVYFNEVMPGPRNVIVQVPVNGGEVVPLTVPLKAPYLMDLSKDGTALLIASHGDEHDLSSLWIQQVAGGSPRRVGNVVAQEARFGADDATIIYGNEHDVYEVNRDGSSSRKLFTEDNFPYSFRVSPDGRIMRFSLQSQEKYSIDLMEAAANGSGLHKLSSGCCGKWTLDGRYFVYERMLDGRTDLWALPEGRRFLWQQRSTKPIQLTAGPMNFVDPVPGRDGKRVFAIGQSPHAEVIRYDSRTGQFVPYLSGISAEGLAFSPDGQWVTYTSYPDGTLWRSKIDGSERLQLTFPPMRVLLPQWSPDGRQIAFNAAVPEMVWNIYLISSDGGTPQRVFPSEEGQMDVTWSADGKSLAFGTLDVLHRPIYRIDLQSKRVSTLPGSDGLFSPRWSPDGKYMAAITTELPFRLRLYEFATQKWTELYSHDMGYQWWSHDGKYIYFQALSNPTSEADEVIVRIRVIDRKLENIVDMKKVGRLTTGTIVDWFGPAPDDSPLFARDISTQEVYAIDMDW